MSTPKLADESFDRFKIEAWFFRRIAQMRGRLTAIDLDLSKRLPGDCEEYLQSGTDWNMRRDRARRLIANLKIDQAIIGKNAEGKAETFAAFFERFYGEGLIRKPRKEIKS